MLVQALILGLAAAGSTPTAAPASNGAVRPIARSAYDADVAQAFERMDVNRDKHLSKAELAPMIARTASTMKARSEASRRREFARLDKNRDGNLSLAEFLVPNDEAAEPDLFVKLDASRDGLITLAEFSRPAAERFNALDKDSDGMISVAEQLGQTSPPARTKPPRAR